MTSAKIGRVNGATRAGAVNGATRADTKRAGAEQAAEGATVITSAAFGRGRRGDGVVSPWEEGVLAAIGLDAAEERAYVTVLEHHGLTTAELARRLEASEPEAASVVRELEAKAMVSRTVDVPARYLPVSPDVAVGALVAAQESKLHRARLAAERLRELAKRAVGRHSSADDLVDVITGREAIIQRYNQLQAAAEQEVLGFDRPPYANTVELNLPEFESLARGVTYRVVYDQAALEYPGGVEHLRRYAEAGEQVRIFSSAPLKLAVFDRRAALIPQLDPQQPEIASALLLRSSTLLDALVVFFEYVWQRAIPITLNGTAAPTTDAVAPATDSVVADLATAADLDADVTALLAAGFKDGAIARRLGVSTRTVDRRISALMSHLNARTRFQAGYAAGHQTGYDAGYRAALPSTQTTPHPDERAS